MSFILDEEKTWVQRDFGLDGRLVKGLSKLGFTYPTMVQAKCVPIALQGKDALVRARTGSGKTVAFGLPVLHKILQMKEGETVVGDKRGKRSGKEEKEVSSVRALILAPSKELCKQIEKHVNELLYYCKDIISMCSMSDDNMKVQKYRLRNKPDIVISTPARVVQHIQSGSIDLSSVQILVIDEADLVLSFGYAEDVQVITSHMPKLFQGLLMSATLSSELEKFKRILLHNPVVLKLDEEEKSAGHLLQFYLQSTERDKFLILYVFLKLGLLQGKGLIFVNDVNKCYRLKLFLQQFYISSAVLNAEIPLNSRLHILEEFNRGVFDYLIATDASIDQGEANEDAEGGEEEINADDEDDECKDNDDDDDDEGFEFPEDESEDEDESDDQEEGDSEGVGGGKGKKESLECKKRPRRSGSEMENSGNVDTSTANMKSNSGYGVSRGIDFQNVTFVVNFDFPTTTAGYVHRIGRTARGGASGTALSFVTLPDPTAALARKEAEIATRDSHVLHQVRFQQPRLGTVEGDNTLAAIGSVETVGLDSSDESRMQPSPLQFNFRELDNFRYRVEDTLRSVTQAAVKEFRAAELKREILNSNKLKSYFAENPNDLRVLRHDKAVLHPIRQQEHLKYVPDYLIPSSMRGVASTGGGGRSKRRRKTPQPGASAEHRRAQSKSRDPLLNCSSEKEESSGPHILDKNSAGDNVYTWKESQNYSTSGRQQWKKKHRKGEFNPKRKPSLKMDGSFQKRKIVK